MPKQICEISASSWFYYKEITLLLLIFFQILVHTSMDSLYEHVPRDALPKDYGGSLASIETYHS